ncbi:MAG: hypothetical protein ACNI3A_01265 [Desulfovibrio sp.]|uniref:hypothetical protein n=1 Tax=Desulfovibrio sp. 7SRBS1 TaxID=3378064 RepID=UPI003B4090EF
MNIQLSRRSLVGRISFVPVLLLGLTFFFCTGSRPVLAAQVTVFLPYEKGASSVKQEGELKDLGFVEAVYTEALGLLPGQLGELRGRYLKEFLAPRAGHFVLSYSQGAVVKKEEGAQATMDVRVNRGALKSLLQRLGLFNTLQAGMPFTLSFKGPMPEDIGQLNHLQVLSGVVPDTTSQPDLEVSTRLADGKTIWRARLVSGEDFWEAAGPNLDDVWYRVWSGFFSRKATTLESRAELPLTVSGWFFPEGASAFDQVLASWDPLVSHRTLQNVNLNGVGVSARWSVAFSDRNELEARLAEYTHSRGLSFILGSTNNTAQTTAAPEQGADTTGGTP